MLLDWNDNIPPERAYAEPSTRRAPSRQGPSVVTLMHGKEPIRPATGQDASNPDRKNWQAGHERIEVQPDGRRGPSGK